MMDSEGWDISLMVLLSLTLSATFLLCLPEANQPAANHLGSVLLPIQGNVYPLGHYTVNLYIGSPPKLYALDIDSGSDLTWVECNLPCKGCSMPPAQQYKPHHNALKCSDPLCAALNGGGHHCDNPDDQCDYELHYIDGGSSRGVLVSDYFTLKFSNGSALHPRLAFGCGYDQEKIDKSPTAAGVLGLGSAKVGVLSQLLSMGLTSNVVGHCLSGRGGGFLFLGADPFPSPEVVWTPILPGSSLKHYKSGPADLYFKGTPTSVKGIEVIFDSGSTYTYFSSQIYNAIFNLIYNDLKGKPLVNATADSTLPNCWKGSKPFRSIADVKSYFNPLALSFTGKSNVQFQLPPEAYLIVSGRGNVCLGILDSSEKLGNVNVIGDISLQDKLVIYDNEKQQIGWAHCDRRINC